MSRRGYAVSRPPRWSHTLTLKQAKLGVRGVAADCRLLSCQWLLQASPGNVQKQVTDQRTGSDHLILCDIKQRVSGEDRKRTPEKQGVLFPRFPPSLRIIQNSDFHCIFLIARSICTCKRWPKSEPSADPISEPVNGSAIKWRRSSMVKQATSILDQRVAHPVDSDHSPYRDLMVCSTLHHSGPFITCSSTQQLCACSFAVDVPSFSFPNNRADEAPSLP